MRHKKIVTTTAILLAMTSACGRSAAPIRPATPAPSSTSTLRADWLHRMVGLTAFDALRTLPAYMGTTMRQPSPRFILVIDGTRTSNLDLLTSIQASELFELKVVGESQSLGSTGDVEIVVTTLASRPKIG